mmetsp:Transcript_17526/g.52476  ORF Transcript_17526/g.52476 Transcript_17526/m.52476 type:complete len:104 (-) Transcript_17526:2067-2378(-)
MTSLTLFRTLFPRIGAIQSINAVPLSVVPSPTTNVPSLTPFQLCAVPKKKRSAAICKSRRSTQNIKKYVHNYKECAKCGRNVKPHVKCLQCMYDRVNEKLIQA